MKEKSVHVFVWGIMLYMLILVGCKKEDTIIVNIPTATPVPANNSIEQNIEIGTDVDTESLNISEFEKLKLNCNKASEHIRIVNVEDNNFVDAINNNPIDAWYNSKYILYDSSIQITNTNTQYYEYWTVEAEYTMDEMTRLLADAGEENSLYADKAREAFWKYIDYTNQLYDSFLNKENDYYVKETKDFKIACSFEKADKIREYTTLLKELIYLISGDVSYTYTFSEDEGLKMKDIDNINEKMEPVVEGEEISIESTIKTIDEYNYIIVGNVMYTDIMSDCHNDVITKYVQISGGNSKKTLLAQEYKEKWNGFLDASYQKCLEVFEGNDKNVLFNQLSRWQDYSDNMSHIFKYVIENSQQYKKMVSDNSQPDMDIYLGNSSSKYYFELLEYVYITSGDIETE